MPEYKQVLVIRRDLNMRRGKECAQASHASMGFLVKHVLNDHGADPHDDIKALHEWATNGTKKVCLQAPDEQTILDLAKQAEAAGLRVHVVIDSGRTEFHGNKTITAMAIGPNLSEDIDKLTRELKLY